MRGNTTYRSWCGALCWAAWPGGRVSRWLCAGVLSGRAGESVLTTAPEKLPFQRLYFYGLGPMQGFDERRYRVALKAMRDALWLMVVVSAAILRPGLGLIWWVLRSFDRISIRTAEVTLGGVDTRALNSRTMAAETVEGLYFIGEAVDVTGWLGGFNFQWAWASGWCAGQAV